MRWRDGVFCHWPVEPAVVQGRLPDRLDVATHQEKAYLGVVPFVMEAIRPRGLPERLGRSFPELNLRTYVERESGVYFFSLDADDRLSVALARRVFRLPYYRARMRFDRRGERIEIRSRRTSTGVPPAAFDATVEVSGTHRPVERGSLEAFLVENYRFFTESDRGRLYVGEVDHEPWRLATADVTVRENGLFAANGFEKPAEAPICHHARPLEVRADRIRSV
ncbi:YqjF family protein [Natronorarus salvus]|uniref:YqjF family protein n=1 Tax=Natronorarus salvus TaxID=3117733 RepID=UPI0039083564